MKFLKSDYTSWRFVFKSRPAVMVIRSIRHTNAHIEELLPYHKWIPKDSEQLTIQYIISPPPILWTTYSTYEPVLPILATMLYQAYMVKNKLPKSFFFMIKCLNHCNMHQTNGKTCKTKQLSSTNILWTKIAPAHFDIHSLHLCFRDAYYTENEFNRSLWINFSG